MIWRCRTAAAKLSPSATTPPATPRRACGLRLGAGFGRGRERGRGEGSAGAASLQEATAPAEAEKAYAQARELAPDDLLLQYNSAALYALWGRSETALGFLGQAMRQDPEKVRSWLAADPMFDSLKATPGYESVVHGA